MGLCSVSDIYKYLKQSDTDPSTVSLQEEQWLMLIDVATAKIENLCNRTFSETSYTEYGDGTGNKYLFAGLYFFISSAALFTVLNS